MVVFSRGNFNNQVKELRQDLELEEDRLMLLDAGELSKVSIKDLFYRF